MAQKFGQTVDNQPPYGGKLHYPGMPILESDPTQVQSPLFEKWYGPGVDILGISKAEGYIEPVLGHRVPYWTAWITDVLQSQPNEGTGLADELDLWVESITQSLLPALVQNPICSIWQGDVHLNPSKWNNFAIIKRVLDRAQLAPEELHRVQQNPVLQNKMQSGQPLTIGELFQVIGEVLSDKEDFNFIPHARQDLVRFVKSVEAYLYATAQQALSQQVALGLPHPTPRAFFDHKSGLMPISLADEFGLGGNNVYSLLRGFYRDWWLEGKYHRGHKVVVVGGTATEYTLEMLKLLAFDLDFFVVVMMPWCGNMGVDSLLSSVEKETNRYGKKMLFTWDWLPTWQFGPKPPNFDMQAQLMRGQMVLDELGPQKSRFYDGYQILVDEWRRVTKDRARLQAEIEAAEKARLMQDAQRLRQQMPAPAPMLVERLVRQLTETQANGSDMFWSMDKIVEYLRYGGG